MMLLKGNWNSLLLVIRPKDDNRYWDDFRLDIDFKEDFPNVVNIECATTFHYKLNHNNNLLNGNLKCKSLMRNSRIDKNLPLIKIQQKTNMTIPLNKKLHFSVYGSYTLDKKRSVILPATSIPYKVGAGFSYEIGKHAIIKSQTNYQYNIIQKNGNGSLVQEFFLPFSSLVINKLNSYDAIK